MSDKRTPAYAALLPSFAENYITIENKNAGVELKNLQNKLGKPLEYRRNEAQYFVDSGTDYFTGTLTATQIGNRETESTGPALLQLWDFIATMDQLDVFLQQSKQRILRLDRFSRSFSELKSTFPPPDLRPWGFHETFPESNVLDADGITVTTGQALGAGSIYDPGRVIYADDAVAEERLEHPIRTKTSNELSQDEAHMHQFQVIQVLYALAQGLFRVDLTRVNTMDLREFKSADDDATLFGLASMYETFDRQDRQWRSDRTVWVNGFLTGDDHLTLPDKYDPSNVIHQLLITRPKNIDMRNYPDNRFYRELLRGGITKQTSDIMYMPREVPLSQKNGGAIGIFITVSPPGITGLNHVVELTTHDIPNAFKSLAFHPMYACRALGLAFEKDMHTHFLRRIVDLIALNKTHQTQFLSAHPNHA